jgi:hypothetical protein
MPHRRKKKPPKRAIASTLLGQLSRISANYLPGAASRKFDLLRELDRRRLPSANAVQRFHEALSFLHAYPDNRRVRVQAERMLARFSRRSDLRRFAAALEDSGIAGTPITYSFYWSTALWLETKWPGCLSIDWELFEKGDDLWGVLYNLLPFTESMVLDDAYISPRELVEHLKKPNETDAGFLIRRVSRSLGDEGTREMVYEDLDVYCTLSPRPGTPARTGARYRPSPVVYQSRALDRSRPDLKKESLIPPLAVHSLSRREGRKLIDMSRAAMVARTRDLYAFQQGDANDVRMIECGDGLEFAAIGLLPEYRLMLDTVYGFLTLKNGVPIGYVLTRSFFNSSEVAYNVFETFRGGESARVYGRVLSVTRHLFGADVFTVEPYQMGHDNEEGQESGAWWFYYKLGFRSLDAGVNRLVRRELARMRRNPAYRSSPATLNQLSSKNMFLYLEAPRRDVRGIISLENIGLAVSRYLALRFGSDRERGVKVCEEEAAELLGTRSYRDFTRGERLAFRRWSPLILALPGVARWSRDEKRALARIARAKGGRRESDYVRRFDSHRKLRQAILKLASSAPATRRKNR